MPAASSRLPTVKHSQPDPVISGEQPNPYIQILQGESVLLVICQYQLTTT